MKLLDKAVESRVYFLFFFAWLLRTPSLVVIFNDLFKPNPNELPSVYSICFTDSLVFAPDLFGTDYSMISLQSSWLGSSSLLT